MNLIVKKNNKTITLKKSSFENEKKVQNLIKEHPELIPLDQIKEDIELIIIAREFRLETGLVDAIGIDEDANIYIIETKLFKNPDKRSIVAQAIDYAANFNDFKGTLDEIIDSLNNHSQLTHKQNLRDLIIDRFEKIDEEATAYLNELVENIRNGIYKIVLVLDRLDDGLKRIIKFINENSNFDIYAVEISYYQKDDFTIFIPTIYGGSIQKDSGIKSSNSYKYKPSNEVNFIKEIKIKIKNEARLNMFSEFIKILKEMANKSEGTIIFSTHELVTGPVEGLYLYDQLNSVNIGLNSNGKLNLYIRKPEHKITKQVEIIRQVALELEKVKIIDSFNPNKIKKTMTLKLDEINESRFDNLVSIFRKVTKTYK